MSKKRTPGELLTLNASIRKKAIRFTQAALTK
jgi:hypothetical protein